MHKAAGGPLASEIIRDQLRAVKIRDGVIAALSVVIAALLLRGRRSRCEPEKGVHGAGM